MSSRKAFSLAFASLLVSLVLPATVQAQYPLHPVYTSARFQIGNGLPIPIVFVPAPRGGLTIPAATFPFPTSPATIMQGATMGTAMGTALTIPPAVLTEPGGLLNIPVFLANPAVFQVATSFFIDVPVGPTSQMFVAGGRTGPAAVSWCPGWTTPTAGFNPACPGPAAGKTAKGILRYTKTKNQFGGPNVSPKNAILAGKAIVAFNKAFAPGCPGTSGCLAGFNFATGVTPGAIGAKFGVVGASTPAPAVPGTFPVDITAMGAITMISTAMGVGSGVLNSATSFAGPWTTGMLTVSVTNALGMAEVFIRSGMDSRVGGVGGIQLISGSVSARAFSGPNANRGWITLVIPEPGATLGAAGALLALVTCHGLVRRRSR